MGNQFLAHIRGVDAIAHVVRCFANTDITHVYGSVDPRRDIDVVNTELILADLEITDRRLEKLGRLLRLGEKAQQEEARLVEGLKHALEKGQRAEDYLRAEKKSLPPDFQLLTAKPTAYVANVDDPSAEIESPYVKDLLALAAHGDVPVVVIAGKLEMELTQLETQEREEFRRELGVEHSGLEQLARIGYDILGLITFFTIVRLDLRAWTVPEGTSALHAAGKIHSDMERGFIRAEVVSFQDFLSCGSEHTAREQGLLRAEGKDYTVKDGDIIHFRFNA